jgi:hypothetical protein
MSKRQGLASKLLAVLGGVGLVIGICATRASAQALRPPPWSNANFANRYIRNEGSDADHFTGVIRYNPNGNGRYTAGSLSASGSPFFPFQPNSTAPTNFCNYSLSTTSSGYAVTSGGSGTEVLTWIASASNNANCPPSFTENDTFVIRNNVTANNTVPRIDFSSNNFLGQHSATFKDPGYGYVLK